MIQVKNLNVVHKKDLRTLIENFNVVLNDGDKAAIIGEEGNGKSTFLQWLYNPQMALEYCEASGERIAQGQILAYLPQELALLDSKKSIYEYFMEEQAFFEKEQNTLKRLAREFGFPCDFYYSDQQMGTLSGGEKVKTQLLRILLKDPDALLLDEPSNDIDLNTLKWLEQFILKWEGIVLYISHDETFIENTANTIIHMEQICKKTKCRHTVAHMPYKQYVQERLAQFKKQEQIAASDMREKRAREEKYRRIYQSVEYAQDSITRQNPAKARLLKKKMHAVKSMGRRFEREYKEMAKMPESEDAIYFKIGCGEAEIPLGKTVIDFSLEKLYTPGGTKVLAENISLHIRGPEKICIVGKNGAGKTTLLQKIKDELLGRQDICVEYMPQDYAKILNLDITPVDFLCKSGDKEEQTKIRTYLGALKYTPDEMNHAIRQLSGGQKAKIFLLKMSLADVNVLVLDEPTRNFSPLSGPVIRQMLKGFPGAIISISHDRKYIGEVCDKVYRLTQTGLEEQPHSYFMAGEETL